MTGSDSDVAFAAFVTRSSRRLLHLGWLLTGNRHHAEDLAQTALLRTYKAWPRVREDDAAAYAARVLINAHRDERRRPVRETSDGNLPDLPAAPGLDGFHLRDALGVALRRLTVRERQVVALRYYLDLSEAQTAERLGIRIGTVKSTASRALAKLRVDLGSPPGASTPIGERLAL